MDSADPNGQVLKKVYFIKRAREGEELVTLLKNKFKTIDAIRDVIGWFSEGREFSVDLTGWDDGEPEAEDQRLRFDVTRRKNSESNRSVLGAIGHILQWLDRERPFDIALIPKEDGPGHIPPELYGMGLN